MAYSDYLFKKQTEKGKEMRSLQKQYFAEKNPAQRKDLLNKVKKLEKEFDSIIHDSERELAK